MASIPVESIVRWGTLCAYFTILLALSLYGFHRWYLLYLYRRHREEDTRPSRRFDTPPVITVQLPLYNELHVVERLIDAVCAFDYPRDRLEIQVLDDSTDDTTDLVRHQIARKRSEGFDIVHMHRTDRKGYKAGALEVGQKQARGEMVAIFDADFVPPPNFPRRLVDYFTDPRVGMVQARWGHLNRNHSALTRVQSIFLDGHFIIEHTARHRSGRFFNFNGTAGMWRRRCVEDAGGWQHDTLTEDLDLSYRAQMRGWKFVFLPDEVAPAEIPVEMGAFKSQQHRWAKGSIQTARKILPQVLRSGLPLRVKTEAVFHLTANVGYVLMLLLAVLVVPAVWLRKDVSPWLILSIDLPLFSFSTISVAAFYLAAQREAHGTFRDSGRWIPFLMAVGIGLSVNNARAVLEALRGQVSEFHRTPKYNLARGESLAAKRYRRGVNRDTWIEAGFAVYFAVAVGAAAVTRLWAAVPFLMLFQLGYTYTAATTLAQSSRKSPAVPA